MKEMNDQTENYAYDDAGDHRKVERAVSSFPMNISRQPAQRQEFLAKMKENPQHDQYGPKINQQLSDIIWHLDPPLSQP